MRKQLALALKYLRHPDQGRTFWIDAICIDQDDPSERNHQVQMMSRIYTRAKEVCIWLGDGDDSSKRAIDFIRDEIMELRNFDALCNDRQYTDKWKALMMLMQRDWFEYVSELGASLLVQATGKVFRAQRSPLEDDGTAIQSCEIKEADIRSRLSRY